MSCALPVMLSSNTSLPRSHSGHRFFFLFVCLLHRSALHLWARVGARLPLNFHARTAAFASTHTHAHVYRHTTKTTHAGNGVRVCLRQASMFVACLTHTRTRDGEQERRDVFYLGLVGCVAEACHPTWRPSPFPYRVSLTCAPPSPPHLHPSETHPTQRPIAHKSRLA